MEVECIGNTQIIHMEETGMTQRTIGLLIFKKKRNQGKKPTLVFKTRIVGADWLGKYVTVCFVAFLGDFSEPDFQFGLTSGFKSSYSLGLNRKWASTGSLPQLEVDLNWEWIPTWSESKLEVGLNWKWTPTEVGPNLKWVQTGSSPKPEGWSKEKMKSNQPNY